MPTFTPPGLNDIPPTLPSGSIGQSHQAFHLFKHYRNRPEGRNVYIYSDDSVSENDPDGNSTLWSEDYRMGDTDPDAVEISACFYGGHGPYTITTAQATLLTNAGYTVDP